MQEIQCSCCTSIPQKTKLSKNALSSIQCNLFRVYQYMSCHNKKISTCLTILNGKEKAGNSLPFVFSRFISKQGTTCNAFWSLHSAFWSPSILTKSPLCIDFLCILIITLTWYVCSSVTNPKKHFKPEQDVEVKYRTRHKMINTS